MNCDVLVIGGGMAGCAAALRAAEKGASVIVASRAPGTTWMHSGLFDIDADPYRPRRLSEPENPSLEHNLARTALENPLHPYSIIENAADEAREAMKFFFAKLTAAGLELAGAREGYLLIGNSLGTMKRARMCLATMSPGDFSVMRGARLLVLGIAGLDSFNPAFVAGSLREVAEKVIPGTVDYAAGAVVELPGEASGNLPAYRAAEILGRSEAVRAFIEAAVPAVQKHKPTHIALPAVMGMERPGAALKLMSQRLSAECFELASPQPSVPGARLQGALEKALSTAGVLLIRGAVEGKSADELCVALPNGDRKAIDARAVVLATGKFISGGIRHGDVLCETVFGLPVFIGMSAAEKVFMYDLVTPDIADKQPVFSAGVRVDSKMRPLDARGAVVAERIFCAGPVIGGYDPMRDRCGSGVAIVTGCAAGAQAAAAAGK